MTDVRGLVLECERQLRATGSHSPRADAEGLMAATLNLTRTALYLHEAPLDETVASQVRARLGRRCGGESLQYVLGEAECLGHRLQVGPGVFIPRPETEVLIAAAIACLSERMRAGLTRPYVLEVGVGSGAIAIALAMAMPACTIVGVELSWMALSAAVLNCRMHGLERRVRLLQGDWTQAVRGAFDLIISNPPYVSSGDVDRLLQHELDDPRMSLDGGVDGVAFHHRLIKEAPRLMAVGGALCMECAEDQADRLARRLARHAWAKDVRIIDDLTGRPRGVWVDTRRSVWPN